MVDHDGFMVYINRKSPPTVGVYNRRGYSHSDSGRGISTTRTLAGPRWSGNDPWDPDELEDTM